MKLQLLTRRVFALTTLALVPAAFAATETEEQMRMQKEGIQLIRQMEEVARDVRYNAGRLDSFTRSMQHSKWTHYHHLQVIKELVNEGLQPALKRLQEIQPHLPEWKQESIDKMMESGKALAADTHSAFLAKNDAGIVPPALNAEYKELVTRMNSHAEELVKISDAAGNYAEARLKASEAGIKVPKK